MLEQQLRQCLADFVPSYLEIINESAHHGGYFEGKETHFKVTIVSDAFEGLRLVQRHQLIYKKAADLMQPQRIHALALHTYTEQEWQGTRPNSPECAHGSKLI